MAKEYHMYTEMLSLLDQYEEDIYSNWCNGLEQACLINLDQPLISRNTSSNLISLNFNPKVINVMCANILQCLVIIQLSDVIMPVS